MTSDSRKTKGGAGGYPADTYSGAPSHLAACLHITARDKPKPHNRPTAHLGVINEDGGWSTYKSDWGASNRLRQEVVMVVLWCYGAAAAGGYRDGERSFTAVSGFCSRPGDDGGSDTFSVYSLLLFFPAFPCFPFTAYSIRFVNQITPDDRRRSICKSCIRKTMSSLVLKQVRHTNVVVIDLGHTILGIVIETPTPSVIDPGHTKDAFCAVFTRDKPMLHAGNLPFNDTPACGIMEKLLKVNLLEQHNGKARSARHGTH
ncbi:hypothetical protein M8C21_022269 [Ambrosia artemisiifolia]|uniref:Uncharacterized protein n=1 Tax=Ambrosia artemisiifolia TaxID=4212 RepID=A0AAD5GXH6_AMBAR|nr:hypothetical protein M8C21_022269 [Ambrosia artemisiifolia]